MPKLYESQVKISKTSSEIKNNEAEPGFDAKNELDPRSDTICAGSNWRLLSASGYCCDVYGFKDNFKGIDDVPISRVATGIRDEHGHMHILIVNKALYFGSRLYH